MGIGFRPGEAALEPGEEISLPLALDLPPMVVLPIPGLYRLELRIDETLHVSVPFLAMQSTEELS